MWLVVAGGCLFDDPTGPATTGTGSGTATEPTTTFGTAGECNEPYDCQLGELCEERTCVSGACGLENIPAGEPGQDEDYGDCYVVVCDGEGGPSNVPGDDPPFDEPRDCAKFVCEDGNALTKIDDSDTPDDENPCTQDMCMAGEQVFTPLPAHTACSAEDFNGYCHSDVVCRRCQEVSDACEDYGSEPHENQETSQDLGTISDNDVEASYTCGSLKGTNDIDWYTFFGDDKFGNLVDPAVTLSTQGGVGAQVCVYFQCAKGGTNVSCEGATPAKTSLGNPGCCASTKVAPKFNCGGLDDAARVWIKVHNPQMLACVPYTLDYKF